jgi:hypothetical protein
MLPKERVDVRELTGLYWMLTFGSLYDILQNMEQQIVEKENKK